nr:rhodanese-like domain-containing protein [Sedimentibacter sp.]
MYKIVNKITILILSLCMIFSLSGCTKTDEETQKPVEKGETESTEPVVSTINKDELKANIDKSDWIVVDTRDNNAFNGWAMDGVERGGHIDGAVDFSANWLKVDVDNKEQILSDTLNAKGITSDKNIVLYDTNGVDAAEVAEYLKSNGFTNIFTFDVNEWAKDETLSMVSYPNYEYIVPALWVNQLIKGEKPETYENDKFKIFEVSWGEPSEDYIKSHIEGAVHINTDEVEVGPIWNRLSDEELEQFALNNGITNDTTVILYCNDLSSMPAYRVGAILKYVGVEDVRILNGGFQSWTRANYDVFEGNVEKTAVESFGIQTPAHPEYIIDMKEAKEILANPDTSQLVSVRSWEEYIGETPGYSDITIAGRIPGDYWGQDIGSYVNIDGTMRNFDEVLSLWKEWNVDKDKYLAFYCGTGWRVAEALYYSRVAGLENTALFDGGWYEWIADTTNPIETGVPNK